MIVKLLLKRYTSIDDYNPNNSSHLFSEKPWWFQSFIGSNVYFKINGDKYFDEVRPKTGEETRASIMFALLMGAKGLVYDREQSDHRLVNPEFIGIGHGNRFYDHFDSGDIQNDPWTFLRSDDVGADFFLEHDEPLGIDEYLDFGAVSDAMEVSRDRIYIGRKSTRCEIKKIHDWVLANEETLMDLRLASWYGKGYRVFRKFDNNNFSADPIENIIDYNSIKTRPLDRVKPQNVPHYEQHLVFNIIPLDSGFYDITLLRRSSDLSIDDEVYLGIFNRRTDPLVIIDNNVYFYTTAEVDEFASVNGGYDYVSETYQNKEFWQDLYWKRLGCREITIPIKNRPQDGKYLVVKVKELGKGTDLDNEWWRQNEFISLVDTSIGFLATDVNTKDLIVKLLPGEGKILQFDYVYSDTKGDLAYSNQHKLVCYPSDPNDPSKVRYHSVYHRQLISDPTQFGVFYRRSQETISTSAFESIEWEDEIHISANVELTMAGYTQPNPNFSCYYPSLVVRNKMVSEVSTPTVYVAFEGFFKTDAHLFQIMESQFDANSTIQNVSAAKCLEQYFLTHPFNPNGHLGKPVINASANGNYYVWAKPPDSTYGGSIQAAWKTPEATNFEINHKREIYFNQNSYYYAHPSVNNYSRIDIGENDCAMVWQESQTNYNNRHFHVYYTRLKIQNNELISYMPQVNPFPFLGTVTFNAGLNAVCLSCVYDDHSWGDTLWYTSNERAFIMRDISVNESFTNEFSLQYKHDRIYWEVHHYKRDAVTWRRDSVDIACRAIELFDATNQSPIDFLAIYPFRIYSIGNQLNQPNAANGLFDPYLGENTFALTFVSTPNLPLGSYRFQLPNNINSTIWQIIHGHYSLQCKIANINGFSSTIDNLPSVTNTYWIEEIGLGAYPHLSSFPSRSEGDFINNRRIYQFGSPSAYIFSKPTLSDNGVVNFKGYVDTLGNKQLISKFGFENLADNQLLSIISINQNEELKIDTLYTDWTKISEADMKYLTSGNAGSLLNIAIQRKRDGRMYHLSNTTNTNTKHFSRKVNKLINGGNELYRIVITKANNHSYYTEELAINVGTDYSFLSSSESLSKSNIDDIENLIDLGANSEKRSDEILIYPNPATDKLYINLLNIRKGKIRILSSIGVEMQSVAIQDLPTQVIDISRLTNGMYNVLIEYENEIGQIVSIGKSVIILR